MNALSNQNAVAGPWKRPIGSCGRLEDARISPYWLSYLIRGSFLTRPDSSNLESPFKLPGAAQSCDVLSGIVLANWSTARFIFCFCFYPMCFTLFAVALRKGQL